MMTTVSVRFLLPLLVVLLVVAPSGAGAAPSDAALSAAGEGGADSIGWYHAETSGEGASASSWLNMGTAHGLLGYTAIASGIVSVATGGKIAADYESGDTPSSFVSSLHTGSSAAAAGLAIAACATGLLAYWNAFDPGNGITTVNSHIVLGLLATAGFIASMITAPEGGDGAVLPEDDYAGHCVSARVSGVMMFASVIVIQF